MTPAWADDAVIYGVLPPKFGQPPLRATTARLADIAELGVNALWLSPINATIPFEAGYAVTDYFTVRSDFGTAEDLRALVSTAHELGLRVLMDFVPNHTSDRHRYYVDAKEHGPASKYYDLYDRDESGRVTHYFQWDHLPNLNFENPDVRRLITDAMAFWVREFDVDGYRVDVAWGVKQRRPDFWPELRRELARIKPDVFLLAEASARDPYYINNGFDAAYDWTDRLGEWAWHDAWQSTDGPVNALDQAVTNRGKGFPAGSRVFRFLNNNDTGERFVARHGPGLTKVAAAMLFTLPGIPAPYTGDEIGASFHPYNDIEPLDWSRDPHELRPYYRRLIDLRHDLRSLNGPHIARITVDPPSVYAYVRWCADADPVLVLLNFSDRPAETSLALSDQLPGWLHTEGTLVDRLHDARYRSTQYRGTGGRLAVDLPAYTARVLTLP